MTRGLDLIFSAMPQNSFNNSPTLTPESKVLKSNTPHQASRGWAQSDLEPEVPENEYLALDTGCLFPTPAVPTSNSGPMTVVRRELQCKGKGQQSSLCKVNNLSLTQTHTLNASSQNCSQARRISKTCQPTASSTNTQESFTHHHWLLSACKIRASCVTGL